MLLAFFLLVPLAVTPATPPDYKQVQLAASANFVAAVFGLQNEVFIRRSNDSGKTFSAPQSVGSPGVIALGMHRGPRVAITGDAIVVSVVGGAEGKGRDGDLLAYRSTDKGTTWSKPVRVNDVAGSAREGLHAMAAGPGGLVYAAWLDLRKTGTRLYGSSSMDSGRTWSANREIYASPSGTICQCCHPSVVIDSKGAVTVMWRNDLDGNRDLYLATSADRGDTFSAAQKLGTQSWKLDACPMDGGAIALDADSKAVTIWRRANVIFVDRPGMPEQDIHAGKNPTLAFGSAGMFASWTGASGVSVRLPGKADPVILDGDGAFPQLLSLKDGHVLAAWERKGQIVFKTL